MDWVTVSAPRETILAVPVCSSGLVTCKAPKATSEKVNQQSPHLKIPEKGPIHKLPTSQLMNPTQARDLLWIWPPPLGKRTDQSTREGGSL